MIQVRLETALVERKHKTERGSMIVTFRDLHGSGEMALSTRDGHMDGLEVGHVVRVEAACRSTQYGLVVEQGAFRVLYTGEQWRQVLASPERIVAMLNKPTTGGGETK